ncbi:MAG: hypothetical protein ACKV0T_13985 [Planctomycetales bacterium]
MNRLICGIRLLSLVAAIGLWTGVAEACPMCSQSIADENALPRAYMYSILFMLGMPALVFSGMGLTIYRAFTRQALAQEPPIGPEAEVPVADQGSPH